MVLSAWKGSDPVHIVYNTQPKLNRSLRASTRSARAGLRQLRVVGGKASQAEIEDLDPIVRRLEPNVAGFDVAVHEAMLVNS